MNTLSPQVENRMATTRLRVLAGLLMSVASACDSRSTRGATAAADASPATQQANAAFGQSLDLAHRQDFDDAARGLIARPSGQILGANGAVLVDFGAFAFIDGAPPPTVNPSLWRHAKLNNLAGLFTVTDGVYQLRGFDIANMTLVEGRSGWIVVDPLPSRESAAAALAFARLHLGARPVSAVVFTHSHLDHFGGVLGVLSAAEAAARKVPIVAPAGFMEEATSENVLAGTAMSRRSSYQFGKDLERSATGLVDAGLGKNVAYGTFGILAPTQLVTDPSQEIVIDGERFIFHNSPGAEAPAGLTFSLPARKAYGGAELVTQTMHNLLPLRGAKVRDALRWSEYLDQALLDASGADVLFASHTWPTWGQSRIAALLTAQRDVYKYTHDQTVRLMNAGLTPTEIADRVTLPASLQASLGSRGYYGDLRHNVKAVYQFYLGAYDGIPAHLDPLPAEESSRRYVALFGGADRTAAAARLAFDQGDYRWAAQLLNHVVFAQAGHTAARALLAQTYEQLGYVADSATWRNAYLTGAAELRRGPPTTGVDRAALLPMLAETPVERFLEAMAAGLDGPAAEGKDFKVNLVLADTRESFVLWIENAVLHFRRSAPAADANATLTLSKVLFTRMVAGTAGAREILFGDEARVSGSKVDLARFFLLIDKAPGTFAIVTP